MQLTAASLALEACTLFCLTQAGLAQKAPCAIIIGGLTEEAVLQDKSLRYKYILPQR